ncbi:hypothetical protein [Fructobacillus durionis]|uniref:Uncharacterized membrane-anchored protein n=1 Tax=Fructobacillus durionis TaxID=283737 RepID=A0A1I1EJB9_9LACO|nr:hypothetical protein [Fructobacillus durionis]SFB87204.1 Uncharacterized membrane-anchored protein [Fructobacillus durionis]
MKVEDLIERNNDLRPGLNKENKEFYDDFLVYVRTTSWLKDDIQVEEQLLAILQDILEAQKNGESARDYFGQSPKLVADNLLKKLPNDGVSFAKIILYTFFGYLAITFLPTMTVPGKPIDIGAYVVSAMYMTMAILLIVRTIGTLVYRYKASKLAGWLKNVLGILAGMLLLFPAFAMIYWLKTPVRINLDGTLGIFVIILFLLGLAVYNKTAKQGFLSKPVFFYIIFSAIIGILTRLPILSGMLENKTGQIILAVLILLACFISTGMLMWQAHRDKKDDDQ